MTRAIAFVDLSGFTAFTEQRGDDQAADVQARFLRELEEACSAAPGVRCVKHLGDGALLAAADVEAMVSAVVRVVRPRTSSSRPLPARAGIAAGSVVELWRHSDPDYLGHTVNLAARLCAVAPPLQILMTEAVAEGARALQLPVAAAGRRRLASLQADVDVWGVSPAVDAARVVAGAGCVMRAPAPARRRRGHGSLARRAASLAQPTRRERAPSAEGTSMRTQKVDVSTTAQCPPDKVWPLLADATTWSDWAGFDDAGYLSPGRSHPHGVGAVRSFRVGRLRSQEQVLAFEPGELLSYDYRGSLPIKDYVATVSLTEADGGTVITWRAEFQPKVPLTGWLLRVMLSKVLGQIADRLAAAAAARDTAEGRGTVG